MDFFLLLLSFPVFSAFSFAFFFTALGDVLDSFLLIFLEVATGDFLFNFLDDSLSFLSFEGFSVDAASFLAFACCINEKDETLTEVPGGTFGALGLEGDEVGDVVSESGDCGRNLVELDGGSLCGVFLTSRCP